MIKDIKRLFNFSIIFGAILGITALIPILGIVVFLIMLFCASFIIMIFLKQIGYLTSLNEKAGIVYGALSGFFAFIGFSAAFLPSSYLLSLIIKESYYTGIGIILKSGFSLSIMLILFIGILCAMMNAFSGLASIYFFNNKNQK